MANPVRYDEYFKYHLSCGFELSIPGGFSDGYKIPKHIDYYGDVNPVFVLSDRYEELVIVGLKPVSPPNALSNRVKTALFSHKDADPVFVEDIDFAYDEFSSDLSPIRLISMFFGGVPFDYPSPKNFTVDQISSKNPLSKVRNEWANGKASVSRSGKNVYVYGEDFEYTIKTATAKSGWATYGYEIKVSPTFESTKLIDMDVRNKFDVNLLLIKRGKETFSPKADTVIYPNDVIIIIAKHNKVSKFEAILR